MFASGSGPSYAYVDEADTGWKSHFGNLAYGSVSGQQVTIFTYYVGGLCKVNAVKRFQ